MSTYILNNRFPKGIVPYHKYNGFTVKLPLINISFVPMNTQRAFVALFFFYKRQTSRRLARTREPCENTPSILPERAEQR